MLNDEVSIQDHASVVNVIQLTFYAIIVACRHDNGQGAKNCKKLQRMPEEE